MKKTDSPELLKSFRLLALKAFLLICTSGFITTNAQTTLYSTDFGTVANVNPVGWTFTGLGMNTSTNTPSTGYTGFSAGVYIGEGNSNTFTNTAGIQQLTSPLGYSEAVLLTSSTGYSNITLSFGMRKASTAYNNNATYALEWSTNGTTYTPIVYTEATAGAWGLASGSGLSLPSTANNQPNLYFRWSFNRTGTGSNIKFDDISVTGSSVTVSPATISFLSNDTTVSESTSSANFYVKLTSTSTASSAVTISVSALSNASSADYTISALTLTFAANAPVNSTYPVNVALNNDVIIESSEYIIATMGNLENINVSGISQFAFYIADNDKVIPSPSNALNLNLLSSFSNTVTGSNSAEIVVHDPTTQRLYIANSIGGKLDIVDFVNPSAPSLLYSIPITSYGNINCVAVLNGTVAAAIENTNPQDSGKVVFFNQDGVFIKQVNVGMMPDMITFNHAGTRVLTANEGEPNAAYTNDPDGSVSIVDISNGVAALTQSNVAHATFTVYNGQEAALRSQGIRIYGLNANASKDLEPEYIAVSKDDSRAWVTLQENNAVAEINLTTNSVTAIRSLGTKDYSQLVNGLDASNVTRSVNIANFPIKGMYLPDAIATYTVAGINYIITANEGDSRAYSGFTEEQRISSVTLDPTKFPLAAQLKNNYVLGRLNVTDKLGDTDNDGDLDTLFSYGARSFSIWNANTGVQVYDSKDDFEMITSTNSYSVLFNASNTNTTKKDRSDDKGPEPEGVTIGTIGANTYAFIALERIGGVMVYDVTNPLAPVFVTYANNRSLPSGGPDNGSEGIIFIPQSQSPNGMHLVIAANEVSSTLSIWGIAGCSAPISSSLSVSGPTANICSNNTPTITVPANANVTYQWSRNGMAIPGATLNTIPAGLTGSYSVAITGSLNCSTASLAKTFSVNASPVLTVTGASSVCVGSTVTQTIAGASTYSWSSGPTTSIVALSPPSSIVYSITGTGTNNCVSSTTSSLTVNANPTVSINGGSVTICNGAVVSLTATGASTYSWSNGPSTNTVNYTPSASIVYSVTGTNTNNCIGMTTTSITVNANPTVSINGGAVTICNGAAVNLTAIGASTYSWSSGPSTNTVNYTPSVSTVYSVTGTSTNNCTSQVTTSITVNANPTVSINSSTNTVCNGSPVTFTALGASGYTWSTGPSISILTATPAASGVYTVIGSNSNNCLGFATASVTVNQNPNVNIGGVAGTICKGTSITLTAGGATSYSWNTGATTAAISPTLQITTNFTVTGTDANGCSGSATLPVFVASLPPVTASGNPNAVCIGNSASLTAAGANTYTWSTNAIGGNTTVTPVASTIYTVTATGNNNCVASATVAVATLTLPVLNLNASAPLICSGESLTLSVSGAATYSWNNGMQTAQIIVTPTTNTTYTVTGINTSNCSAFTTLTQSVASCLGFESHSSRTIEFVVYPNPASTAVRIDIGVTGNSEVKIYNAIGSLLMQQQNYTSGSEINIEGLSKGIYFIGVINGGNQVKKKLVVE